MFAVIENNAQAVDHYFNVLRILPEADNNIYRLMTISDIAQTHFTPAIEHMKVGIQVKDLIDDRLMLASLYSLKGDQYQALVVLKNHEGKPTPELIIHQLGYTLLNGDYVSATRWYQYYKQNKILIHSLQFTYYALIINLLNEELEQVEKQLMILSDSEELYNNALQFIRFIKRNNT